MEETMKNLELQKRANDVRKGIVTAVHGAKAGPVSYTHLRAHET